MMNLLSYSMKTINICMRMIRSICVYFRLKDL